MEGPSSSQELPGPLDTLRIGLKEVSDLLGVKLIAGEGGIERALPWTQHSQPAGPRAPAELRATSVTVLTQQHHSSGQKCPVSK